MAVLAAVAALALGSCGDDDDDVTVDDLTQETEPNEGIFTEDLRAVLEDPEYVGQEVTVKGEVVANIGDARFHIGDGDGNGLLVFGPVDTPEFSVGAVVQVTGTVRTVAQASVEDDFGTPYDESLADFLDKPAIDATSVDVIDAAGDSD